MAGSTGTYELVAGAQVGDEVAIRELFEIIRTHHMPRYVGRYRGRNVLVDDAEIESEFMLGVWLALDQAKLDVGNPLAFMCWKGQKKVQSLFRTRIRKQTRYQCLDCGHTGIMAWKARVPACQECGDPEIETWMVENAEMVYDDLSLVGTARGVNAETAWGLAVYGIQIEELRARLNGRARDLFDIIVFEGISRESSRNYLQEIADRWGCSTTNVALALRKLRREVAAYLEEE